MRVRLACVSLALLGALTACGDDAAPSALPTLNPAPSASATPTAAAPPASAQAATPQGAAAFARFWFETLNAAAVSGDTAALRSLAAPTCVTCRRFADSIDSLYTDGGGIAGGVFSVVSAEAPALEAGSEEAAVTVVYDVTPTRQLNKDGSVRKSIPAIDNEPSEMRLRRSGPAWLVLELV